MSVDRSLTSAYDYRLPPERIARYPVPERDQSRMLLLDRATGEDPGILLRDLRFSDLTRVVSPGDLLVVNESRVIPVRLLGRKPTGAPCEVLLLRPVEDVARRGAGQGKRVLGDLWEALVRPGSKLKPGREVIVSDDLSIRIEGGQPGGGRTVRLLTQLGIGDALERYGRVPLPPYLDREDEPSDRERYQTVYARDPGSVAAPTAGLHFTETLLESLSERGVLMVPISLHVGPGTFRPVDTTNVSDHRMESETWSISPEAAKAMNEVRADGGRLWAVGTTVVRTLETAARRDGVVQAGHGQTDLFVTPGFQFRVVEGLITNFHLPRSTLLMLVAAFAGYDATMQAYRHAVRGDYRFYSYGDAMAISPVRQ